LILTEVEKSRPSDQSQIEVSPFLDAARPFRHCYVTTYSYDLEFRRFCGVHVIRSVDEVVAAAFKSYIDHKGKFVYFHKWTCHSEHWVLAWKYGVAWSVQRRDEMNWVRYHKKERSEKCQAPEKPSKDSCKAKN